MEWRGDEALLGQMVQLFVLANSPDNNIQQQVLTHLNEVSQKPDFPLYLVTIFAKMTDKQEVLRQQAGLVLKTHISRSGRLPSEVSDYIQANVLIAVADKSRDIRHTAGTVLTALVQAQGMTACMQSLEKLTELLGQGNPEAVEGSFNALNKICEDGVSQLKLHYDAPPEQALPFLAWCSEKLLPRVFEYADPRHPVHSRQNAIEILNHFALNWLFNNERFPMLIGFSQRYVQVCGSLSTDSDRIVLLNVCKGFVTVIGWDMAGDDETCSAILRYMLKSSAHEEYTIRQEALEVWTPCLSSARVTMVLQPMLPELVPVLLNNMVYHEQDYANMHQDFLTDDANQPDHAHEIQHRFHRDSQERRWGEEEDDEVGHNGAENSAWGQHWTARKAAASTLDNLAERFRNEILPMLLPHIEKRLTDSNWEVVESGVLALGAIARGCMNGLEEYLPNIMDMLLKHCQSPQPLLRTISCWSCTRFSAWIVGARNKQSELVLRAVLKCLLERILDRNKSVQEAACSAFATLEEEARGRLVPYLDDIVGTLVKAFDYYQAKNLLVLYDAVGTLAECVNCELDRPEYVQALVKPLAQKFCMIPDTDRGLIALFECLGAFCLNLGMTMLPMVSGIVDRCLRVIMNGAHAHKLWKEHPDQHEQPNRDVMASALDVLASIIEGLQGNSDKVLNHNNFLSCLPEVLADQSAMVRQSAFALVGDAAKFCIQFLAPYVDPVLEFAIHCIENEGTPTVHNNASWCIGEICIKVGPQVMNRYASRLTLCLVNLVPRAHGTMLMQNACITLGRLAGVCPEEIAKHLPGFGALWLEVMKWARNDDEKVTAFLGFTSALKCNPGCLVNSFPQMAGAFCSFVPMVPHQLRPVFTELLVNYKKVLVQGGQWEPTIAALGQDLALKLHNMYPI